MARSSQTEKIVTTKSSGNSNRGFRFGALTIAALFAMVLPLSAHHSSSAYDLNKHIEWNVTVTRFVFVNPHSYVFFNMQDSSGKAIY